MFYYPTKNPLNPSLEWVSRRRMELDMAEGFGTPERRLMKTRADEEIWECQIPGRVWVEVTNHKGAPTSTSVTGVGTRLRLTTEDRELIQERIRQPQDDPFVNGMLLRVDADQQADEGTKSADALSESDLKGAFELEQDDFEEFVASLGEVNIRRLKALVKKHGSVAQDEFLDAIIEERYAIGGTTPTWEEMQRAPK